MISPFPNSDPETKSSILQFRIPDLSASIDRPAPLNMSTGAFTATSRGPVFEDAFVSSYANAVFLVVQGLGRGEPAQSAAEMTVAHLRKAFKNLRSGQHSELRTLMKNALVAANTALTQASKKTLHRLQSTLVLAVRHDSTLTVKAVGDCRAYLLRNECLKQLTRDHSLRQFLASTGPPDTRTFGTLRRPDFLLNFLGRHDFDPNDEFHSVQIKEGDRFLLCSKGLTSGLSDPEIESIMQSSCTAVDAATNLGRAAVERTPINDVTCVAIFADRNREIE